MAVIEHLNPLLAISVITGLLSIYYLFSFIIRLRKASLLSGVRKLVSFSFFACVSLLLSLIILGTQGYLALTKEEPVAIVKITPTGEQSFNARFIFNDKRQQIFNLKGDELMVDAYILKWKPWANILGLHTAYRLERVSGRYKNINDERDKQRTIFAIKNKSDAGIARWRNDYSLLSFLLDVENGSASFINVEETSEYQLMVTTNGLLLRPFDE